MKAKTGPWIKIGIPIFLMLLTSACVRYVDQPKPEPWPSEENAIVIHIKASQDLNYFEGQPNSLLICVYQLAEEIPFLKKMKEPGGLDDLVRCNSFNKKVNDSIMESIQPGDHITSLTLDRMKNTRFVAIVAGYEMRETDRIVRVYPVNRIETKHGNIFNRFIIFKPEKLEVNLILGRDQIESPIPSLIPKNRKVIY